MHNSAAVTPVPLTLAGVDWSGGATARSGGAATAIDNSANELRSKSFNGCLSYTGSLGTYLDDAESQGSAVQCRRRRSAAALMAIPRRFFPGQSKHARNIKMGPTGSTDAAGGRNRAEKDSPAAEKTNSEIGRKGDFPKSAPPAGGESKLTEG